MKGTINYHIGIEGMAAKFSVGVLANSEGTIISAIRSQPISLHTIPEDTLVMRLIKIVKTLLNEANLSTQIIPETSICIGLGGATFTYDREFNLKENIFKKAKLNFPKIICTGDAEITFVSCAQKRHGSIVISHLGSTVLVVNAENDTIRFTRFGGWGQIIGDEGSAYKMGLDVLKNISLSYDKKEPLSILWKEVDAWLSNPEQSNYAWKLGAICWNEIKKQYENNLTNNGKIDPRTLLFYFSNHYNNSSKHNANNGLELWRNITGGFVVPLMRAYDKDKIAKEIVEKAIGQLVWQHKEAFNVSQSKISDHLVLYGGVFNHNPKFTNLFKQKINKSYNHKFNFITKDSYEAMRPVCGALLLSLSNSETQRLRFPNEGVIKSVFKSQLNFPNILDKS
ncbi:MAG: BadF/BadG/BcrA/BcrD ATPase family protein [Bacteroidota bacterium]